MPHFMGYRFGIFNYATTTTGGYVDVDWFHASDEIGQGVATNPCISSTELLTNGGFEGSLTPWTGNGTAQLALVTDEKASGASGVYATGRTKTGDGPQQSVANKLIAGQAYAVTAKVKYSTGPATKQFYVTVMDNAFHAFNMAGKIVTKGEWSTITGTYTVPASGLDLTTARVFVETVWTATPDATNDLMNFWVDDVSISGASSASFDGGLVDNGGFETGALTPWTGNGCRAGSADQCRQGVRHVQYLRDRPRGHRRRTATVPAEQVHRRGRRIRSREGQVHDRPGRQAVQHHGHRRQQVLHHGVRWRTKGEWTDHLGRLRDGRGPEPRFHPDLPRDAWTSTPTATNDLMDFWADDISIKATTVTPPTHPVGTATPTKKVGNSNPLMDYQYGADPWGMSYDGKVYVYMTGDASYIDSTGKVVQDYEYDASGNIKDNTYGQIKTLNILSSADLVNWTNEGAVKVAGANGAAKWAANSWAPAATHKTIDGKEKFFLYFANSAGGIGVLTSDSPSGPFVDPIGKALITSSTPGVAGVIWLFDPAVLIDDDGSAYLYFGGGVGSDTDHPNTARVIKLGDDMISVVGSASSINAPALFEDSGINKINGKYYYSYCTNFSTRR